MIMFISVLAVGKLALNNILILIIQVVVGATVYVAISALFKLKPFLMCLEIMKKFIKKA